MEKRRATFFLICLLSSMFCLAAITVGAETTVVPATAGQQTSYGFLRLLTNEEMGAVTAGAWVYNPRFLAVQYEGVAGRIILWDEGVSANGVRSFSNTLNLKN